MGQTGGGRPELSFPREGEMSQLEVRDMHVARDAIRELVARYNAFGDSGRFDALIELFASNALLEIVGERRYRGPAEIRGLFEEGTLPGRQISEEWFTTKRQLLDYIENNPASPARVPEERRSPKSQAPLPTKFRSNIGTNAWECKRCGAHNEPLRVECLSCGYVRNVALIDFTDHGLPKIEIPDDLN